MAIRVSTRTTGGGRIKAHLRERQRRARAMDGAAVSVGFKGSVAGLAARHEYGDPAAKLPERPVFRLAAREDGRMTRAVREGVRDADAPPTRGALRTVAEAGRDGLVRAFLSATGEIADVGERQARRKAGTPGEGRTLVGTEGPKMIEHVSAWVDDNEV